MGFSMVATVQGSPARAAALYGAIRTSGPGEAGRHVKRTSLSNRRGFNEARLAEALTQGSRGLPCALPRGASLVVRDGRGRNDLQLVVPRLVQRSRVTGSGTPAARAGPRASSRRANRGSPRRALRAATPRSRSARARRYRPTRRTGRLP